MSAQFLRLFLPTRISNSPQSHGRLKPILQNTAAEASAKKTEYWYCSAGVDSGGRWKTIYPPGTPGETHPKQYGTKPRLPSFPRANTALWKLCQTICTWKIRYYSPGHDLRLINTCSCTPWVGTHASEGDKYTPCAGTYPSELEKYTPCLLITGKSKSAPRWKTRRDIPVLYMKFSWKEGDKIHLRRCFCQVST